MYLTGHNIDVRSLVYDDINDYYKYQSDSEVARLAGFKVIPSIEVCHNVMMGLIYKGETYTILNKDKVFLGTINLYNKSIRQIKDCYTIGISLKKEAWGKGYGKEAILLLLAYAFKIKKALYIEIGCEPTNLRSKKLIEKIGFKYIGLIKDFAYKDRDITYDLLYYSLSEKEYKELNYEY